MIPWTSACAACAALALVGCQTQLQSRHDGDGRYVKRTAENRSISMGVDYAVPMLQFQITATRTLAACTEASGKVAVKFIFKVTAEPHYVAGERFVIDYEQLSGWSKISKIDLQTYDNGTIKSLNAAAEDKSASIIGDAVKSVVRVVSLAQGVPLAAAQDVQKDLTGNLYACSDATKQVLAMLETRKGDLKSVTARLVALTDEAAMLERLAPMGVLDAAGRRRLVELQSSLKQQAKLVADIDGAVAELLKRVSVEETITWPLDPGEHKLDLPPSPGNRMKLAGMFQRGNEGHTLAQLQESMALKGTLAPTVAAKQVECTDPPTSGCARRQETEASKSEGLLYRSPVPARLLICDASQDDTCAVAAASGVVMAAAAMAPQLGELRLLPYRNGVFQNNELKATFRENGAVEVFTYDEKVARGQELSGAVLSALDQAVAYRDAREAYKDKKAADRKAEADAEKKAQLDALDQEIARLEKLKKISELQVQTAQGSSVADIESETARLQAQIALLEARKKLQDAEAALAN